MRGIYMSNLNKENERISLLFKQKLSCEYDIKSKIATFSKEELIYIINHFEDIKIYCLGLLSALL